MMRRIAVVGDQLDTGGEIGMYEGPVFTIGDGNKQVALIGGAAYCETCKTTGTIAKAGGPRRLEFMGETALDHDIVLCKCPEPPRIAAKLAGESWCDDMAETCGAVVSGRTARGEVIAVTSGDFDEQVRAKGRGAAAGYPYFIEVADGRVHGGRLASDGLLPRVLTEGTEDYAVYWGDEALAKQLGA
jgi:hypothetical protein